MASTKTVAIVVTTTVAERLEAEKLANAILDAKLAACVQISGPIESHYCWNGRREIATEWSCSIKTRRDFFAPLEKLLQEIHPYDVPEILATAATEISMPYQNWLNEQLTGQK
ncbi:MAG: divalent-cation tolerance protein CutA [Planctomycetaceae bacterium]